MRYFKKVALSLSLMMATCVAYAESSYNIAELYSAMQPPSGTKAVGQYDKTIDAKYILTPTRADTGKYIVKVTKIGDNLYLIKDTDLCVETRYCYKSAYYPTEVVLIIESNYGYNKGKIIFD